MTVFTKTCHMAWRHNKCKASIPAWVETTRLASKLTGSLGSVWSIMLHHCTTPTYRLWWLCNYFLNFQKKKPTETQKPLNWEGSHTCSSSACSPHVKRTPSPHNTWFACTPSDSKLWHSARAFWLLGNRNAYLPSPKWLHHHLKNSRQQWLHAISVYYE